MATRHTALTPGRPVRYLERRQAPRLDVFGQLEGCMPATGQRVLVLDISTGGLGIAVRAPLELDAVHSFRLTAIGGDTVTLDARVANIRESSTPTGTPYFVVGIQLLEESEDLNRIIDNMTSALSFD